MTTTDRHWQPKSHRKWTRESNGATRAEWFGQTVVVFVYTYPGSKQHAAFTSMQLYLDGELYDRRWPRHYSDRWLGRLANEFEGDVVSGAFCNKGPT